MVEVKSGRRNRKTDEDIIKQIISLANQLLNDEVDDIDEPIEEETNAKSEEPDTVNDEERARMTQLLEKAKKLLEEE